ncbi:hypothetical protein GQX74_008088 [Glossina fuscipes]|nr:hypothetical protein GQX74_008088 [Glossina fuscipes]
MENSHIFKDFILVVMTGSLRRFSIGCVWVSARKGFAFLVLAGNGERTLSEKVAFTGVGDGDGDGDEEVNTCAAGDFNVEKLNSLAGSYPAVYEGDNDNFSLVRLLRLNDLRDFFFFSSLRAESKMASISLSKVWSLILEEFKSVLSSTTFSSGNAKNSSVCSRLLAKLLIVCSSRKSGEAKYRVLAINGSNNKPRKANSCPLGITTLLGEYSSSKRGKVVA